jgi:hypothetical protein
MGRPEVPTASGNIFMLESRVLTTMRLGQRLENSLLSWNV